VRDPWAIHRADVQGLAGLKYINVIKYTIEYMAERGGFEPPVPVLASTTV
jgi:hypothetical protein